MIDVRTHNLKRVSKRTAFKLFSKGKEIYLLPCKTRPDNMWQMLSSVDNTKGKMFYEQVNEYEYYNCNSNFLGKYASYYVCED